MNRVNRKVEYALMALKHMGQKIPGELTTAKEVSETFRVPFDATARVMQLMASKGLLRSEHGAAGGYQILKDLGKVSFLELVEMIEGPTAVVRCLQKESSDGCEIHGTCNIMAPLNQLNMRITDFYGGLSLKELLFETLPGKTPRKKLQEEGLHG